MDNGKGREVRTMRRGHHSRGAECPPGSITFMKGAWRFSSDTKSRHNEGHDLLYFTKLKFCRKGGEKSKDRAEKEIRISWALNSTMGYQTWQAISACLDMTLRDSNSFVQAMKIQKK
jgi:hypothetical protein